MKSDLETQIDILAAERQLTKISLQMETYWDKITQLGIEYDQITGELNELRSATSETL